MVFTSVGRRVPFRGIRASRGAWSPVLGEVPNSPMAPVHKLSLMNARRGILSSPTFRTTPRTPCPRFPPPYGREGKTGDFSGAGSGLCPEPRFSRFGDFGDFGDDENG